MNIEKQVCSLEHAKRLKELGVPQDSLFYWVQITQSYRGNGGRFDCVYVDNEIFDVPDDDSVAAFTAGELGEILPSMIVTDKEDPDYALFLEISKDANEDYWDVEYSYFEGAYLFESDFNLANAMAKMLIYLIENNLVNVKE